MIHYVYTTARGLCRTVHAEHAYDAWRLAEKKHKPQLLADLTGATWVESTRGGAIRDRFGDVSPKHARNLYFQACLAEIPNAQGVLRSAARDPLPGALVGVVGGRPAKAGASNRTPRQRVEASLRLLVARGLYRDRSRDLTDLGRAFAAWIQGGGQ